MRLLVSCRSQLVEQIMRWQATDMLVAVGTDVVVAWQCCHRLVELAMSRWRLELPPSAAATKLRQDVLPQPATGQRGCLETDMVHEALRVDSASQHVRDSTSNSCVQAVSVSSRIRSSFHAGAAKHIHQDGECRAQTRQGKRPNVLQFVGVYLALH